MARRTHAMLEQPQLVVEAVRVDAAVRSAQPRREAPARAGAQFVGRSERAAVIVPRPVPAERDAWRHCDGAAAPLRLLDIEAKAHALRPDLRQAGDDADELHVVPFDLGRQRRREVLDGARTGQREAERTDAEQDEGGTQSERHTPATQRDGERDRSHRSRQQIGRRRPQCGLLQLQRDTREPGQRRAGEAQTGIAARVGRLHGAV